MRAVIGLAVLGVLGLLALRSRPGTPLVVARGAPAASPEVRAAPAEPAAAPAEAYGIAGVVRLPDGAPAAGAKVICAGRKAATGPDGAFVFEGVKAHVYGVTVRLAPYREARESVAAGRRDAVLRLGWQGVVRGRVVDVQGAAVRGADVHDLGQGRWPGDVGRRLTKTDERGEFRVTLPPGSHEFVAVAGGHRSASVRFRFAPGETPRFLDLVLDRAAPVSYVPILVEDPDGAPLGGIEVGWSVPVHRGDPTDDQGFALAPALRRSVAVNDPPWFVLERHDTDGRGRLDLEIPLAPERVVILYPRSAAWRQLRVIPGVPAPARTRAAADGEPVRLRMRGGVRRRLLLAKGDQLAGSQYLVQIAGPHARLTEHDVLVLPGVRYQLMEAFGDGAPVAWTPTTRDEVEVLRVPEVGGADVTGRVTDGNGRPLAGVLVGRWNAVAQPDGTFTVTLPCRPHGVRLQRAGYGRRFVAWDGAAPDLGTIALPPAGRLRLRTRLPLPWRADDWRVRLHHAGGHVELARIDRTSLRTFELGPPTATFASPERRDSETALAPEAEAIVDDLAPGPLDVEFVTAGYSQTRRVVIVAGETVEAVFDGE